MYNSKPNKMYLLPNDISSVYVQYRRFLKIGPKFCLRFQIRTEKSLVLINFLYTLAIKMIFRQLSSQLFLNTQNALLLLPLSFHYGPSSQSHLPIPWTKHTNPFHACPCSLAGQTNTIIFPSPSSSHQPIYVCSATHLQPKSSYPQPNTFTTHQPKGLYSPLSSPSIIFTKYPLHCPTNPFADNTIRTHQQINLPKPLQTLPLSTLQATSPSSELIL